MRRKRRERPGRRTRKTIGRNPQEFMNLVDALHECIVIVEGKFDHRALNTLDIKNIIEINRRPLVEVAALAERAARETGKDVVILSDFDREGRRIASRLNALLKVYRVKVNSKLRGNLMEFGKNKIEDFSAHFGRPEFQFNFKEGDIHGKISSNFNKIPNKGAHKGKGRNRKT